MTDHPGIVNGTRIGNHTYTHAFASEPMQKHFMADRPGCVRLQLEQDRVFLQTKAGSPAPFPARLGVELTEAGSWQRTETEWSRSWELCADLDIHVLLSLSIKDGIGWKGDNRPSDPWWQPAWRRRHMGLSWASPNLSRVDFDGGSLWYENIADLDLFLAGIAAIRDLYKVTIKLDGWNECDLRRRFGTVGNVQNLHTPYQSRYDNHALFGYTGGLERISEYFELMQDHFPGEVCSGGIIWQAWCETVAPCVDILSLHVYKRDPAEIMDAARTGFIEQMQAWDSIHYQEAKVAITEISTNGYAGGFDNQQAREHREIIERMQIELGGDRLAYYVDHTLKPSALETGAGQWWLP